MEVHVERQFFAIDFKTFGQTQSEEEEQHRVKSLVGNMETVHGNVGTQLIHILIMSVKDTHTHFFK